MATLIDFTTRKIISDAPGPQRAPGTHAIGQWLVHVAATLWQLSDVLARISPHSPRRRRRGKSKSGPSERSLVTHPDRDVRVLAELAQRVGDAATSLSPPEESVEIDPDLDIPF